MVAMPKALLYKHLTDCFCCFSATGFFNTAANSLWVFGVTLSQALAFNWKHQCGFSVQGWNSMTVQ